MSPDNHQVYHTGEEGFGEIASATTSGTLSSSTIRRN